MNRCKPLLLLLILCLFSVVTRAQKDSLQTSADTLRQPVLDPYASGRKADSYGTYVATVNDPILFHTYAGLSAFNVLRGNTPPFNIHGAPTSAASVGYRGAAQMVLTDGVPMGPDAYKFYNFNAFEYSSASVAANANAVFPFAGIALPSGFFLRSKSGEGVDKPAIEFNSYTTLLIAEDAGNSPVQFEDRWSFNQSVAYAEDYGTVDLRASVNFRTSPMSGNAATGEGRDKTLGFRVNTGVNLRKFSLRFIGDYRGVDSESTVSGWTGPTTYAMDNGMLQGNLFLQYNIIDWLKITSQHVITSMNAENTAQNVSATEDDQTRRLHNIILSANRTLSEDFSVRAFTGLQLDRFKLDQSMISDFGVQHAGSTTSNASILGGLGSTIYGVWDIDGNFRKENYSLFPDDVPVLTYSFSTSFYPTRFWKSAPGEAKLRASFARIDNALTYDFPYTPTPPSQTPPPTAARRSFDIGLDLTALKNRLTFSISHYKIVDEKIYSLIAGPGPLPDPYVEIGELHTKGTEFALGVTSVSQGKWYVNTRVGYNHYDVKIKSDLGSGDSGNPIVLGNPTPDWTGTILNQVRYAGIFLNILFDMRHGGEYVIFNPFGQLTIVEMDIARFRDISLGYSLPAGVRERIGLGPTHISLSARNFIRLDEDPLVDPDVYGGAFGTSSPYLKSLSLSLSISF